MLYLDANVFIYAAINTEEIGQKARGLLQKIQQNEEQATTSVLTFDEVFWSIKKRKPELAIETSYALLNFPNIHIISADRKLALAALRLINEYSLTPRDALHAATAIAIKADFIVSTDPHFDKIKELKRETL
jgi:uncharacterized protein